MVLEQMSIFGSNKKIAKSKPKKRYSKDDLINKYKQLYLLYYKLFDSLNINIFTNKEKIIIDNIIAYPQEQTAEIDGTQFLDIEERIKIHHDYLEN